MKTPLILTVPGLDNSGPGHWQTIWEQISPNCTRVELGMWERPHRNTWVNNLNHAVHQADRPVILAAHSLGCLAVAWWAALEGKEATSRIAGALLVAPPDVENQPLDARLCLFAPVPRQKLPFPSIVVGSHDDPYLSLHAAKALADDWGARFADAGRAGHINALSNLGDWPLGRSLLQQLIVSASHTSSEEVLLHEVARSKGSSGVQWLPQHHSAPTALKTSGAVLQRLRHKE